LTGGHDVNNKKQANDRECICTVLLIAYNHKPYIRLAIESALRQRTEYKYKIHIFDDASTDGTSEIVREYAAEYPDKVIPFIAETNGGAQSNIWNAYKSVDTKYCAILECDDYWCDEEKLQLQIDAMEQNPDCSFCAHNTLYININDPWRKKEDGKLLVTNRNVRETGKYSPEDFICLYGAGWLHHGNSRLIRMSCVDLDMLENREDFLYDNCQFFYLFKRGKLYYIQRVMSTYCMNVSSSFTSLGVQNKIKGHFERLMHINQSTNCEFERLIFRHIASFARYWLALDDFAQGVLRDRNEIVWILIRFWKSLIYDARPHARLKRQARHNIAKLQSEIKGE
jgi:glycosyltransferase involved in cell wall biosynthesis